MANPGQPAGGDEQTIESRRATVPEPDPAEPVVPEGGEVPQDDLPSFGELAPESARPSPLDDIVEAEREQMPRD
jgi:hypothetical protein